MSRAAVGVGAFRSAYGVHRSAPWPVGGRSAAVYDGEALAVESGHTLATVTHPARNGCDRRPNASVGRCARPRHAAQGESAH
jgi:hypothetical protein